MKYMGSKNRIAKELIPVIQGYINKGNIKNYIEPFCGGLNVIDKISCENRLASDKQLYLIELFKNLDKLTTLPKYVSREHYEDVKECFNMQTGKYPDWYVGAIGFLASYNGRFFDGGYAGIRESNGKVRNDYDEACRNLLEQSKRLVGIQFVCADYRSYQVGQYKDCLFYCDPPYRGTKYYLSSYKFDNDAFWDWARELSRDNTVLVSEYSAPLDFTCTWEQTLKRNVGSANQVEAVERLFIYGEAEKDEIATGW